MASRGVRQRIVACTALLGLSVSVASACDVPVFRYALERWPPDPYEIVIFHRDPPTPDTQAAADLLATCRSANIRLRPVDTSQPLPRDLQELRRAGPQQSGVVVRHVRTGEPIWSGPATSELPEQLLNSPARSAVAERLLGGDSAVWLLLEAGNPQRDNAVAARLEEELESLERTLVLPVEDLGLDISFSMLRVSRNDPREEVLVRSLLGSEWDLAGTQEPMAFPVFGRGRVLYALVGPGITRANIREACTFLTGPCACEIKDDNPGFDLLMSVDWTANLEGLVATVTLPSVANLSAASLSAVVAGRNNDEDRPAATDDPDRGRRLIHNTGLAFLIGIAGILVASALLYRAKR